MSTLTRGTILGLDGHVFHRTVNKPWACVYEHTDCHGAHYGLAVGHGGDWSWWATISPSVTLRADPDGPLPLSPWDAFDQARKAVMAWED